MEKLEQYKNSRGKIIYCHFSFKRPKGENYGLFAVAMYKDFDGKQLIVSKTRKLKLWENHQFVTAIQSYEHALLSIYEWQGMMFEAGIRQVMLVTDNSTLAGWIENPEKNKNYAQYMKKAVNMFKVGAPKEIVMGIGLCEPRNAEKSYKFCREDKVEAVQEKINNNKINIGVIEEVKTILDIIEEDQAIPEVVGIVNKA